MTNRRSSIRTHRTQRCGDIKLFQKFVSGSHQKNSRAPRRRPALVAIPAHGARHARVAGRALIHVQRDQVQVLLHQDRLAGQSEMLTSPTQAWIREMSELPKPTTRAAARSMLGLVAFNSEHVAVAASRRSAQHRQGGDARRRQGRHAVDRRARRRLAEAQAGGGQPGRAFETCIISDAARTHKDGGAAFLCQFDKNSCASAASSRTHGRAPSRTTAPQTPSCKCSAWRANAGASIYSTASSSGSPTAKAWRSG
jgi:hypothetical protein